MGSALLDTTPGLVADSAAEDAEAMARLRAGVALRQQAAERLAAHRSKRAGLKPERQPGAAAAAVGGVRAAQIAAAVAERYAKSQSYRAFLAAEAERAVQQACAAAEVAAMKAVAVKAAQQSLLDALAADTGTANREAVVEQVSEVKQAGLHSRPVALQGYEAGATLEREELSFWPEAERAVKARRPPMAKAALKAAACRPDPGNEAASATESPRHCGGFAVRLDGDVWLRSRSRESLRHNRAVEAGEGEGMELDEEIAFRQAPVFEEFLSRPQPLPANLIEFPRQLVASRKARPRLAEGPLREEGCDSDSNQLRIFEVDAAQISTEPAVEETQAAPWTSIFLDTPQPAYRVAPDASPGVLASFPDAASLARRSAAGAINACLIGMGWVAFGAAAMVASGNVDGLRTLSVGGLANLVLRPHTESSRMLLGAAFVVAAFLCLTYQALFFTLSAATPGMRCARIGLCTFRNDNPTRRSMRLRMFAGLLSALSLGVGFLWATVDEDKLTWHDRVSHLYQRTY